MKKLFLIFPILCACTNGQNVTQDVSLKSSESELEPQASLKYNLQIKACDDTANKEFDKPENSTTVGIGITLNNQIECYKSIVYEIIDNNYSKQSESMKKDMNDYIYLSGSLMGMTLRPDSCYPACGTIVGNRAAAYSLENVRKYLDVLINKNSNVEKQ